MWLWSISISFAIVISVTVTTIGSVDMTMAMATAAPGSEFVQHLGSMFFYTKEVCTDMVRYISDPLPELAYRMEHGLDADGLEIGWNPVRDRVLLAGRPFRNRAYVCEYAGERISEEEVEERARALPPGDFGYILGYENNMLGELYNIDASREDGRFCRLASHSWKKANVDAFPVVYRNQTRVVFLTTRDVAAGEELFFDYGHWAMNEEDFRLFPWLAE